MKVKKKLFLMKNFLNKSKYTEKHNNPINVNNEHFPSCSVWTSTHTPYDYLQFSFELQFTGTETNVP